MANFKIKSLIIAFAISLFGGLIFSREVSAKSVWVGFKKNSSYNFSQGPGERWVSGWDSGRIGCGWVSMNTAYSYLHHKKVSPAIWVKFVKSGQISLKTLNTGLSNSDFQRYVGKIMKVKRIKISAYEIAKELYKGNIVVIHGRSLHKKNEDHSGHYVTIYRAKITVEGKSVKSIDGFCISDPGYSQYRGKCYSARTIGKFINNADSGRRAVFVLGKK